jgi:GT2 family glycosyltransferase
VFFHRRALDPLLDDGTNVPTVARATVTLDGESRDALRAPLDSDLEFRVRLPPRSELVTQCGVIGAPEVGACFEAIVSSGDGPNRRTAVVVDDARIGRWVRLTLRVPSGPQVITLRVRLLSPSPGAQALWGEPSIQWRKTAAELRRSVAFGLRAYGLLGILRRLRARVAPDDATQYAAWFTANTPGAEELERMRTALERLPYRPRVALILDGGPGDAVERTVRSLMRQVYPEWELWLAAAAASGVGDEILPAARRRVLQTGSRDVAATLNAALDRSTAEFVATIHAGDELAPHALFEIAARLNAEPDLDLLYSDEDERTESGIHGRPHFKPGWSPEHLLARMYLGRLLVIRRAVAREAGGYRPDFSGALDYDLALRVSPPACRVGHVARVLYHRASANRDLTASGDPDAARAIAAYCTATRRDAEVTAGGMAGVWRVRHRIVPGARVTIVIPTDGRPAPNGNGEPLLVQCIRGILQRTSYEDYDLLVADNGSLPDAARDLLARVPHRRVSYSYVGPFNFSDKINFAVAHVDAPYVLLLNDDVEPINPEWLSAMVEYAQQEPIGAVGAKLFYPDGRLQHVGVAVGVSGIAAHLLHQHPGGTLACGGIAVAVRNCSAVTGACLLTRRRVYAEAGGFDARLGIDFNDVDFCLRVRRAGYRIVFTPYARLYHYESASFGARAQRASEVAEMRRIWQGALEADPYYNPNLSRDFPDCRVRTDNRDR